MRINQFIASCGVASRRASETLVKQGRIAINGKRIDNLATVVSDTDTVTLDGKPVAKTPHHVYIKLNKPRGIITSARDEKGRKTVLDLISLPKKYQNIRLFPVGRLDYDTEGLVILTNDGDFAYQITHPKSSIEKTYHAKLNKTLDKNLLVTLRQGVIIDNQKTLPAQAKFLSPDLVELTIIEGRNRQVRKMFETLGYTVTHLRRTRVGKWNLGDLPLGKWKFFEPQD